MDTRTLVIDAEPSPGYSLSQQFIHGENDVTEFDLTSEAGLGGGRVVLSVTHAGETRREEIDFAKVVPDWVDAIVADIQHG